MTVSQTQPTHMMSFVNQVVAATVTPSSEATDYLAASVKVAGRPFLPWRTTALGVQTLVVNFGAALTGQVLLILNRTNFEDVTVEGNTSDSWGSPAFSQAVEIVENPFNGRLQHAIWFLDFPYQYLRLAIPSQTPTDGAGYYLLGGLWVGAASRVPSNVLADIELETIQPRKDLQPDHDGWRQRLVLGEERTVIRMGRQAKVTRLAPGSANDQFSRWAALDRQVCGADGPFAFFFNAGDPTQGYIVLSTQYSKWRVTNRQRATGDWEFEESIQ